MDILHIFLSALLWYNVSADCSFHCEAYDCPCDCIKNEVRCENRNVTKLLRFPSHMNFDVVDFGNNFITSIRRHQFRHRKWRKLQILQLSANNIETVEGFSFVGLHHLTSLFLNSNKIKHLDDNVFVGLKKLERLYLNDNQISDVKEYDFDLLRKSLELLYLQGNGIKFIKGNSFSGFPKLRILDLSRNRMNEVDSSFLQTTPSMQHLFLAQNPWLCEPKSVCMSYGPIAKVIQNKSRFTLHRNMICSAPEELGNKTLSEIFEKTNCSAIGLEAPNKLVVDGGKNKGATFMFSNSIVFTCMFFTCLLSHCISL